MNGTVSIMWLMWFHAKFKAGLPIIVHFNKLETKKELLTYTIIRKKDYQCLND